MGAERAAPNRGAEIDRLKAGTRPLIWMAPLMMHAPDACAWGLYTHMYFAQLLIWAVPLADPRFRNALRRFPQLCLAATCLPDVSLFSHLMRTARLRTTHWWSAIIGMLRGADSDEDRAMALGYAGHLLTDIVAHNYFVPAHERMWFGRSMLTHAASEWAMDAHLAPHLFVTPASLIARHRDTLVTYAVRHLEFEPVLTRRALGCLMRGERVLRRSRLPQIVYRASCADRSVPRRFDCYIQETAAQLRQINRLVAGEIPAWLPEIEPGAHSPFGSASALRQRPVLPADFFPDARAR